MLNLTESRKDVLQKAEVLLATKCAKVRYSKLLTVQRGDRVSVRSFLSWLDDRKTTTRIRKGLITLYIEKHLGHFDNGFWDATLLPNAMEFVEQKALDPSFVSSKKTRKLFSLSFKDPVWREEAAAIFGLKMLELLYSRNKLQTKAAKAIVRTNLLYREAQNEFAKVVNKSIDRFTKTLDSIEDGAADEDLLKETVIAFGCAVEQLRELQKNYAEIAFADVVQCSGLLDGQDNVLLGKTSKKHSQLLLAKARNSAKVAL